MCKSHFNYSTTAADSFPRIALSILLIYVKSLNAKLLRNKFQKQLTGVVLDLAGSLHFQKRN
jgi:hypothetical protein